MGYVATLPTCGPPVILPLDLKRWGPPRRHGLCSHLAAFVGHLRFRPSLCSSGDPPGGRGYVATLPTCGPLLIVSPALKRWGPPGGRGYVATSPTCVPSLILPPALKRWGPPRQQELCSHLAHLWATCDSTPRSEAVGTPQAAGVM